MSVEPVYAAAFGSAVLLVVRSCASRCGKTDPAHVPLQANRGIRDEDSGQPARWPPRALLASDGRTLTVTFSEVLDETSVLAADAFGVKAAAVLIALSTTAPVSVAGHTAVLMLAGPVGVGEPVTVSYAKERAVPAGARGR